MRNYDCTAIARHKRMLRAATAISFAGLSTVSYAPRAQTSTPVDTAGPSPSQDDLEIIVTARKRSERLFDVPVAVSAVSAQELAQSGANSVGQMAESMPELNIGGHTAGGDGASITIRGVGTDGSNAGIAQSVSIALDGVQVNRGRALFGTYFDLQQAEVMKGPQALFFGKNSPAGVISLTSKNPSDHFEASSSISYEFNAGELIGDGVVSGPIAPGIGVRVAVHARTMEGYMYNDAKPVVTDYAPPFNLIPGTPYPRDGEKEYAGRLTLEFDRGGPFTATFKAALDHYQDDGQTDVLELTYCAPGFPANFNTILLGTPHQDPGNSCLANWHSNMGQLPYAVTSTMLHGLDNNGNNYSHLDSALPSLTMNYKFNDALTLTSVTGDYYLNNTGLSNNDWTDFATVGGSNGETFNQFSEELRLSSAFDGPLNFMVGGYYEREHIKFDGTIYIDNLPADPATGRYGTTDDLALEDGKTISFFTQLTYKLLPDLELSGGARYTDEIKTGSVGNTFANPIIIAAFPVKQVPAADTSENVSPEATLTWRPNHDLTVYGAYKTGFQSGGISLSQLVTTAVTPANDSFRSETAKGVEAGVKTLLFNERVALQATAYRYTYDGLQISAYVPQFQSYVVSNAAASRNYGLEVEAKWRATDHLTFNVSPAYNKSRYLSFTNAPCYGAQTAAEGCGPEGQDLSGRPTLTAPDWTTAVGADYHTPITSDYQFGMTASAFGSTDYYFVQTQSPHAIQGGYVRFNASFRLNPNDERWQLSLIGRNLTNRRVILSGQDEPLAGSNGNPGAILGVLGRPREIALQMNHTF